MHAIPTRRVGRKALSGIAAAIVTAGVASAALAGPASAAPNDPVNINVPANTFQFGNACVAGAAPTMDADVNWRENAAQTTVAPLMTGTLCLQSTLAEARVVLETYDNSHLVVGRYPSSPATGNGSALNTFVVSRAAPRVSSAAVNHVHVQIEQRIGGAWAPVAGAVEFLSYP